MRSNAFEHNEIIKVPHFSRSTRHFDLFCMVHLTFFALGCRIKFRMHATVSFRLFVLSPFSLSSDNHQQHEESVEAIVDMEVRLAKTVVPK